MKKKHFTGKLIALVLMLLAVVTAAAGCAKKGQESGTTAASAAVRQSSSVVVEDGEYSTKDEVAEYIHSFGHLPSNFITKNEAKALGWNSSDGNLWDVAPGKSIGGDTFGNRDGSLPEKAGRKYYECDINYQGGYRGSERDIYSNDGLIYYTPDHYETFELLYGEE
ncbi:MAG: ribonuclease [Parasporobacterium sp.]|nr:ribonuclease [Parasporobacterium sp.]